MKDLLIITNNPERASYRQRIEIYLEKLRTKGIEFEAVKLPPNSLSRYKLFKDARGFKAVLLHKKCLNWLDAYHLRKYSRQIIYDFDDAVMYSPKEASRDTGSHYRKFKRTAKLADIIIAGNEYLAEHARRFNDNVKILPTGLDIKAYDLELERDEDNIILAWIGSKSTLRYLEQIRPALEQIGAYRKNVHLRLICDEFFELENMITEKHQWSLDSQYTDLASSHIGLAPLEDNRFTRGKCGFKILQYYAAGLAVVTSPVGVNAQLVRDGLSGYHARTLNDWIEKTIKLIDNTQLRKQMAKTGREDIQKFDSNIIGERFYTIIKEAVS